MADLTANQRSFVEMMQLSDEHAIRGFDLLLKRPHFLDFFEPLIEAGLFAPEKNPAPVKADKEGAYRIPYWKALDYLTACAKVAGEHDDAALAGKILNIIRTVSAERDPAGERANFYTFRRFAEILGLLPTSSVTAKHLELIEGWLNTKFDHDMVANALDDGALPRFLNSGNPADWDKAVQLFKYCTAIRWQPDRLDRGRCNCREAVLLGLLRSDNEMLRRVGIHVLSERWESLGGSLPPVGSTGTV